MRFKALIAGFLLGTALPYAKECLIALDIGHTPEKPGAISARGVPEYQFNRRTALYTYHVLQKAGIETFFVNSDEKEISLMERTKVAKEGGATHFISFHHDSVQLGFVSKWEYNNKYRYYCDKYSGHSLFVSKKNPAYHKSLKFASDIGKGLRAFGLVPSYHHNEDIKGERKELLDMEYGVYRYDDLIVLKHSAGMPAVLIECGIILNREDEPRLWEETHLEKIASSILGALKQECD